MQPIEIRQSKKKLIAFIAVMFGSQIAVIYFFFFSKDYHLSITLKMAYAGMLAVLIYILYFPVKRLIRNEPIITLSKSEITINVKGKPIVYLWAQINHWRIEKDSEDSTRYLIIETAEEKKKINISWLEKGYEEIEALISEYKSRTADKI